MKLAKREKLFISIAGGVIGFFLVLELLFLFIDSKDNLIKNTAALEKGIENLSTISALARDMDNISGGMESAVATRRESLLVFIDNAAKVIGLEPVLKTPDGNEVNGYIEEKVRIDLKSVTPSKLKDFLFHIEKPEKYIFINSFNIKDNEKETGYLDANIRVLSYKKVNQ